jgi:hypothetical protein
MVSLLLASALAVPARAADGDDRVRELEERVLALEARLAGLQRILESAGPADGAELQRRIDLLAAELAKLRMGDAARDGRPASVHGLGPAASRVYGVARGVSIGGYGEGLYQNFSAERDDGLSSGKTNQYDQLRGIFYFGYKFSDRILFNSEVEFEHASTGEEGEASLEFAYLDFLLAPSANVRAGLVLVPAGFINELHEPPVFLGARRPDLERRLIPTTWRENGVGLFGEAGPFSYRAYLLAGFDSEGFTASNALRGGRQDGSKSEAEDFGFALRADYTGVPGLLAGGFYYRGNSAQGREAPLGPTVDPNGATLSPGTEPFDSTVTLYDLHAQYRGRGLDLRALYVGGHLDDAAAVNDANGLDGEGSVGERFNGWYLQAGYDLLSLRSGEQGQSVIPYVRYERFDTQARVPGEAPAGPTISPAPFSRNPSNDVSVWTYGVAYKPLFNVSIKLDYSDFKTRGDTGVDQLSLAVGYLF